MTITAQQFIEQSGSGADEARVSSALSAAYSLIANEIGDPKHGVAETRFALEGNNDPSFGMQLYQKALSISNARIVNNGVSTPVNVSADRDGVLSPSFAAYPGILIADVSYVNDEAARDEAAYEICSFYLAQSGFSSVSMDGIKTEIQSCSFVENVLKRLTSHLYVMFDKPYYVGPSSGTPVNPGNQYSAQYGEVNGQSGIAQFGTLPSSATITMPTTQHANSSWYIELPTGITITKVVQPILGDIDVTSTWVRTEGTQRWVDSGIQQGVSSQFVFHFGSE